MKPIACYHWWSHPNQAHPYANLRTPLILSIATLRSVCKDIPIVVFDMSDYDNEWAHFKDKLNFKVIRADFQLKRYKENITGWQYLSRIYDVQKEAINGNISFDTIMYIDTDVFWLKDPLPLQQNSDKFCFDGYNTGFYYYNPLSENNKQVFDIFDCYSRAAIYSESFRSLMKKQIKFDEWYHGYDDWYEVWDELVLMYIHKNYRHLFNEIDMTEHFTIRHAEKLIESNTINMLHCNGIVVNNPVAKNEDEKKYCRGILCLVIEELYNNLCNILDQSDLDMIFTKQEQHHYLAKKMSFMDRINLIVKSKEKHGQYYFQ